MRYQKEKTIIAGSWVVSLLLLTFFIPKERRREAYVAFLFKQMITWSAGIFVVEKGFIKYPFREMKKGNKTSFTFEFLVFPTLSALFNTYYPRKKNAFVICLYYLFFTSIISIPELYAERRTKLIKYVKWSWLWSFVSIWLTYYISQLHFRWFSLDNGKRGKP